MSDTAPLDKEIIEKVNALRDLQREGIEIAHKIATLNSAQRDLDHRAGVIRLWLAEQSASCGRAIAIVAGGVVVIIPTPSRIYGAGKIEPIDLDVPYVIQTETKIE